MTYLMIRFRAVPPGPQNPPQPPRVIFADKSNGMCLAGVQHALVEIGDDPSKVERRVFIDHDSAVAWAKVALLERTPEATFEERDGDSQIALVSSLGTLRPS